MNSCKVLTVAFALLAACLPACTQAPEPNGAGLELGRLPLSWPTGGPRCMEMPEWFVHEYNPDFVIMRQSGCTDYEKPFVYLLFGHDRALLYDTGSRNGNLRPTLQHVMHLWMLRNHRTSMPLLIVHSHAHSDHVAGDNDLQQMNDASIPVKLVPATVEATKALYGISSWPEQIGSVDLGERVLDAIPIPGHDTASLALYDRRTGVLLTGDSVYPGRIYIRDLKAFTQSNARLVKFTEGKLIAHILGCHIEETNTAFLDYPVGTIYQPDEHSLALSRGTLLEMQAALDALGGVAKRQAYADFSLWPVGASFRMSDKTQNTFDKVQKYQLDHMWDQTKP